MTSQTNQDWAGKDHSIEGQEIGDEMKASQKD